jgi:hypothetical protein
MEAICSSKSRLTFNELHGIISQKMALLIQSVPRGKVNILGGHSVCHSKQEIVYYMCPIPNGFRDRAISPYSSKIVDTKEILHTLSNNVIYFSSNKLDIG